MVQSGLAEYALEHLWHDEQYLALRMKMHSSDYAALTTEYGVEYIVSLIRALVEAPGIQWLWPILPELMERIIEDLCNGQR